MNDKPYPSHELNENARRILDIAWMLFQQKGYRGLSLDELCEKCALTKPTLYYYFQSKENLYLRVLQRQIEWYHEAITAEELSTAQRLQRLAETMLKSMSSNWLAMLHDLEHIKDPNNHARIRAFFTQDLLEPLSALMADAMRKGEIREEPPERVAWSFLGLVSTFTGRLPLFENDPYEASRWLVEFFLLGAMDRVEIKNLKQDN